jgi:signal peptidase I
MEQYPPNNLRPTPQPSYLPNIPSTPPPPPSKRRDGWKSAVSTILILVSAPLIALAITSFVFQSYEVDGPSMETTLQNQDRLIVFKLPRSIAKLTGDDYIPDRGDIIVFAKRGMSEADHQADKQLIKRVIGLPGDRVLVENGNVLIYNDEHPTGYSPDSSGEYPEITDTTPGRVDIRVEPGEVFVMGDNRTNSLDSRNFGTITADEIVGKLAFRILPISKAESY